MHLVSALAAGIRGAEGGVAQLYNRAQTTRATYYLDLAGSSQSSSDVRLDEHGAAQVFVNEPTAVVVQSFAGAAVRTFTVGGEATAATYRGQSFTGRDYVTAVSGVGKPITLREVLDLWKTRSGATDFLSEFGALSPNIADTLSGLSLGLVNVKDKRFGALGDGVADDTAAVQAACNFAATIANGIRPAAVVFPPGEYRLHSIQVSFRVQLIGCGPNATTIKGNLPFTECFLLGATDGSGSTDRWQRCTGMRFVSALINDGTHGITAALSSAGNLCVENCEFEDGATVTCLGAYFRMTGCVVYMQDPSVNGNTGIFADGNAIVTDCVFVFPPNANAQTHYGIRITDSSLSLVLRSCIFDMTDTAGAAQNNCLGLLSNSATFMAALTGNKVGRSTSSAAPLFINSEGVSLCQIAEAGNCYADLNTAIRAIASNGKFAAGGGSGVQIGLASPELGVERAPSGASVFFNNKGVTYHQLPNNTPVAYTAAGHAPDATDFLICVENKAGVTSGTISYSATDFECEGAGATITNNQFTFAATVHLVTSNGPRFVVCSLRENVT